MTCDSHLNRLHLCLIHKTLLEGSAGLDYLRFTVESGVEINAQDCYDKTPLYYAVRKPISPDVVLTLVELGADPNIVCDRGYTPLRMAFRKLPTKWDLLGIMLKDGGDPDAKGEGQVSVRELAHSWAEEDERHRLTMFDDL